MTLPSVVWSKCSKCGGIAEAGFMRSYCTNASCDFFDMGAFRKYKDAQTPAPKPDYEPDWSDTTRPIWPPSRLGIGEPYRLPGWAIPIYYAGREPQGGGAYIFLRADGSTAIRYRPEPFESALASGACRPWFAPEEDEELVEFSIEVMDDRSTIAEIWEDTQHYNLCSSYIDRLIKKAERS